MLAAEHSQNISLGTSIAVVFPRTPAILAHIAWDLARYSNGRFIMGLGPQVNGQQRMIITHLGLTSSSMVIRRSSPRVHELFELSATGSY